MVDQQDLIMSKWLEQAVKALRNIDTFARKTVDGEMPFPVLPLGTEVDRICKELETLYTQNVKKSKRI